MSTAQERAAFTAGLRMLAGLLEEHPEIPLPVSGDSRLSAIKFHFLHGDNPRADLAAAASVIPCAWDKQYSEADPGDRWPAYLDMYGKLAGLHLNMTAHRDAVCTRVVTGTEWREAEETVTPAVTRMVRREVETVEWQCHPVLAADGPHQPQAGAQ